MAQSLPGVEMVFSDGFTEAAKEACKKKVHESMVAEGFDPNGLLMGQDYKFVFTLKLNGGHSATMYCHGVRVARSYSDMAVFVRTKHHAEPYVPGILAELNGAAVTANRVAMTKALDNMPIVISKRVRHGPGYARKSFPGKIQNGRYVVTSGDGTTIVAATVSELEVKCFPGSAASNCAAELVSMPSMGDHKLMHLSGLVQAAAAQQEAEEQQDDDEEEATEEEEEEEGEEEELAVQPPDAEAAGEEGHYEDALPVLPVAGAARQPPGTGNAAAAAVHAAGTGAPQPQQEVAQPPAGPPEPQAAHPAQPASFRDTIMMAVQQVEATEAGLRADKTRLEDSNRKLVAGSRALKAQNASLSERLAEAHGKGTQLDHERSQQLEEQLRGRTALVAALRTELAELKSELFGTKRKANDDLLAEKGKRQMMKQKMVRQHVQLLEQHAQLEAQKAAATAADRAAAHARAALKAAEGRAQQAEAQLKEAEKKLVHLKQVAAML